MHRSTYRYHDWHDNLLWPEDRRIDGYTRFKREGTGDRLAHENSEDAVTWNVFGTFERAARIADLVPILTRDEIGTPRACAMYPWTLEYGRGIWEPFRRASAALGELENRRTETDVVLHADGRALVFVEAKFGSGNVVRATHASRYEANQWFGRSMKSFPDKYYELARNWLVGTYLAKELDVPFFLISLVRRGDSVETSIEKRFGQDYCRQDRQWRFRRVTWEDLAESGLTRLPQPEQSRLREYLAEKTLSLKKAFALSDRSG